MRKLFKMIALVTTLLVMSASAWGASFTDHVNVAPNGKGDVLIFPVYLAFDGFQTKLQVINTTGHAGGVSAIAKVVIRSANWSQETLDFFIFLSPTDVWEGYLMWDGSQVSLYSEDDSVLVDTDPTFASSDNPVQQPLQVVCDDVNLWGYAEVFLTWVFDGTWTRPVAGGGTRTVNFNRAGVSKDDIYDAFVGPTGTIRSPQPIVVPTLISENPDDYALRGEDSNILAGNLQIQSPLLGWTSALNAVTLRDYRVSGAVVGLEETGFGDPANNLMVEVEAALAKNDIGLPYINDFAGEGGSLHFLTFPTKMTRFDNVNDCRIQAWRGRYGGFIGTSYLTDQLQTRFSSVRVTYEADLYDQEENRQPGESPIFSPAPPDINRFPFEVNWLAPSVFEKGWMRYNLTNPVAGGWTEDTNLAGQFLRYQGAPVIPVTLNYGMGMSLMYGFHTEGRVQGRPTDTDPWQDLNFQYAQDTPYTR